MVKPAVFYELPTVAEVVVVVLVVVTGALAGVGKVVEVVTGLLREDDGRRGGGYRCRWVH